MYDDYPSSDARSLVVVAAPPRDPVAPELADGLERLGLRVALVSDVGPYVGRMSACVVVLRPQTARSSAVRAILEARLPQLLPVLAAPMALPPGPWTAPPITLARGVESAARAVADALRGTRAPQSRPVYPPEPEYSPAPGYPAYPGYQTTPAYPSVPGPGYFAPPFAPPFAPAPAPPPASPAKRRSRAALWIIGSTLLALLLAIGAIGGVLALRHNSAPAAHQTSTPTVPAHFTAYTDTHGLFRLDVPDGWSTTAQNNITGFVSPSNDADFAISTINVTLTADAMRVSADAFFKAADTAGGGNGTYTNLQGPTPVTIAGTTWTREAADLPLKAGTLHAVVLIANHGGSAFLLAYGALSTAFASTDASDFQPILNSFQFLK